MYIVKHLVTINDERLYSPNVLVYEGYSESLEAAEAFVLQRAPNTKLVQDIRSGLIVQWDGVYQHQNDVYDAQHQWSIYQVKHINED